MINLTPPPRSQSHSTLNHPHTRCTAACENCHCPVAATYSRKEVPARDRTCACPASHYFCAHIHTYIHTGAHQHWSNNARRAPLTSCWRCSLGARLSAACGPCPSRPRAASRRPPSCSPQGQVSTHCMCLCLRVGSGPYLMRIHSWMMRVCLKRKSMRLTSSRLCPLAL